MKKEVLQTFIRRYNLNNVITKSKWKYVFSDKTLHARARADNKSFIADVVLNDFVDFGQTDAVICIGDTEKVERMMKPFIGEDINFSLNCSGDRILGFTLSDANCESYCAAADPSSIDPVPQNLQDFPEYHVIVSLTEEFLDTFQKARTALKDVETFSAGMNKKGVFEIVIGYTTSNSNRIRITPATEQGKDKLDAALSFPVKNIAEAFKANEDISGGTLAINSNGLSRVYFKNDKFTCTYYQFANKRA